MMQGDQGQAAAQGSGSDEADHGPDLVALLWRARGPMLVAMLILGLLYAGSTAVLWSHGPVRTLASQDLTFTFDGASKRTYPNGTQFSPQDMLAEPVLRMVHEELHLAEVMSPTDLASALSIRDGGGVDVQLLQADFGQRLQNAKLTQPERDKLEKDYRAELEKKQGDEFILEADFAKTRLAPAMCERILAAIPDAWSRYAKQTRGLAMYDLPVPKVSSFDPKLALLDQWAMVAEELEQIERSLRLAVLLPGASQARDAAGDGFSELQRRLSVLRRTRFEPLTDQVYALDPEDGLRRLVSNLEASSARYEAAKGKSDAAREIFQQYVTQARGEGGSVETTRTVAADGRAVTAPTQTTINLPEDLITRLVEMRSLEGDMQYRQKLNDDLIKSMAVTLDAERMLRLDKRQLEKVKALAGTGTGTGTGNEELVRSIADMKLQLTQYANSLANFIALLAERNLNPSSALYRLDGPTLVVTERAVTLRQVGLGLFGVLAIGAAIGLLVTMRRQAVAG